MITVGSYTDDLGKIGVIVGEVAGILEQPELERPEKSKSVPKDNSVTLEDVRFGYHDKEILHGVTMELKAGTVNAIVGPSGSGKSTIAKLIASLWDVDSGSIKIGGVDVKEMSLADFNRKLHMLHRIIICSMKRYVKISDREIRRLQMNRSSR